MDTLFYCFLQLNFLHLTTQQNKILFPVANKSCFDLFCKRRFKAEGVNNRNSEKERNYCSVEVHNECTSHVKASWITTFARCISKGDIKPIYLPPL